MKVQNRFSLTSPAPCALVFVGLMATLLPAQAPDAGGTESSDLIPQNLLRLVHAPEVHRELNFSVPQIEGLEYFFQQFDGIWFRARVLPPEKQRAVIADLESKFRVWLSRHADEPQRGRLRQLEYRSQGIRMLLRDDVRKSLEIDDEQHRQFVELAEATNAAVEELQRASMTPQGASDEQQAAVRTANAEEQAGLERILRPEQLAKIGTLLGVPFDTANLQRIYPMAPDLVPVEHAINAPPKSLRDLRGKVVILHFYAFQCHNCHANFEHYTKWYDQFSSDQVAVIGIQTPETSRERDPAAVKAAAKERGFEFPVLIDLQSTNWKAWANTMWPTVYVIDKNGYIRYVWQGELNWNGATQDQIIADLVVKLIDEEIG